MKANLAPAPGDEALAVTENTRPGGGVAIALHAVNKVYRTDKVETVALSNINLNIAGGEFLSIMGLLDSPSAGRVTLNDAPIAHQSDRELARIRNREIGFIFQSFHLINDLNVLDNVQIPLLYRTMSGRERSELLTTF